MGPELFWILIGCFVFLVGTAIYVSIYLHSKLNDD